MKMVKRDLKRPVMRPEELRKMFSSLKGAKFYMLWCLAWFGCHTSEFTMLKPKDVNYGKAKK